MKRIKLFEDFKENPQRKQIIKNNDKGGTLIKEDDIVNCISKKGKIWVETIKNIHELIIHLSIIQEKGFTHVDSEMLGVRFLTKSEVILEEIEYLNNRAEQLKQELDGIR